MRGVVSVDVNKRQREAVVVRRKGQASGPSLVQAVQRAGYRASVIPTLRITLDCPDMACAGCSTKVERALKRVSGVRGVRFPSATQAVIYYDGRRTSEARLLRAVKGAGFHCGCQG